MDFTDPDIDIYMIEYEMLPHPRKTLTDASPRKDYVVFAFHEIAFSFKIEDPFASLALIRNTHGRRKTNPSNDPSDDKQGNDIGCHRYELPGHDSLNSRHCRDPHSKIVKEAKYKTSEQYQQGIQSAEYYGGQCNKASTSRNLLCYRS